MAEYLEAYAEVGAAQNERFEALLLIDTYHEPRIPSALTATLAINCGPRRLIRKEEAYVPSRDHILGRFRRFVICVGVGVSMASTAYWCAWSNMRDAPGYRRLHQVAFRQMDQLKGELNKYFKEKGRYPKQLSDLKDAYPADFVDDEPAWFNDPWHHPFSYLDQGKTYTLFSFGPDGKLGGEGFHQDLDVSQLSPDGRFNPRRSPVGVPTLKQFTFEFPTRETQLTCVLAGICSSLACMAAQKEGPTRLPFRLIGVGLTLAACFLTTMVMSAIHIPSGH